MGNQSYLPWFLNYPWDVSGCRILGMHWELGGRVGERGYGQNSSGGDDGVGWMGVCK